MSAKPVRWMKHARTHNHTNTQSRTRARARDDESTDNDYDDDNVRNALVVFFSASTHVERPKKEIWRAGRTFRLPSAVSRSRLQLPQKWSLMDVMNPIRPFASGIL